MPGSRHTRPVSQRPPQIGKNTQGLLASFSFSLLESSVFASRAEGQVRGKAGSLASGGVGMWLNEDPPRAAG